MRGYTEAWSGLALISSRPSDTMSALRRGMPKENRFPNDLRRIPGHFFSHLLDFSSPFFRMKSADSNTWLFTAFSFPPH